MVHALPSPQVLDRPGTIRWAVGSPEGPRSSTWNVIGNANTDDVYVGVRNRIGEIKLSLHPVKWRLAYTEKGERIYGVEGVDRALFRWEQPPEFADGWRRGATVIFMPSNLGPGYPEKRVTRGNPVAFYPATNDGWGLRFDLVLGSPERADLAVEDAVADVGRMTLSSGLMVWIVASEVPISDEYEADIARVRREAVARCGGGPTTRGWGWATDEEDGTPILVDLSNLPATPGAPRPRGGAFVHHPEHG